MWWEIRELWLGASIRTKIKIYALAVILVMGLSAGISVQITGFGLDSFNQILYDNSKCNNFHEALTEETDCFTRYARERSKDNREAYEKACEKTTRCLNQLPFDYASIGSERYAGTWTIKSSYMNSVQSFILVYFPPSTTSPTPSPGSATPPSPEGAWRPV